MNKKEILFIVQYPENASPGQRFRFELYKQLLNDNGFKITTHSFLKRNGYEIIYKQGLFLAKFWFVLKGYFRRLLLLFFVKKYAYIFLQREVTPFGPPVFEWVLIKLLKKKVIYDFDDAIWIPQISDENKLFSKLKNAGKTPVICKWSYKISCGNQFLCNYAKNYSNNVVYNPTCVDTERFHNILSNHDADRITIGWTGSFSTLKYMDIVVPVLTKLQDKYDFDVKIICNKRPSFVLKNLYYVEWSEELEVSELASCQIGLMPLFNDEWSEGKCGFKLIQYLALEIPAVSSDIGVNKSIIENGVSGFLCDSEEQWYASLEKLILDTELRKKMGKIGRKKIISEYSLQSNSKNFLSLFT
jgi:glycosyltransferase involved in cell wall biosynthesis